MNGEPARIAVAGAHGYGRAHLDNVARLTKAGLARLVGVADPVAPDPDTVPARVPVFENLTDLLAQIDVDVVTVATPIHTHLPLAAAAMRAGADVLVEKPPVPSLAAFTELSDVVAQTGRNAQIGFQSLGSAALEAIAQAVDSGRIGQVRSIGATGSWLRPTRYWQRSPWAGHRTLDGAEVTDGVVTNPLAHGVATALRLADACELGDLGSVQVELYQANDIESDDTSTVRAITTGGLPVTAALTLCAAAQSEPAVTVRGSTGRAVFYYTSDVFEVWADGASRPERTEHARRDLLANLLAHRHDPAIPLIAPLARTGSFVRVVEAVRTATVYRVDPSYVDWRHDDAGTHPVLADVEHWVELADQQAALFSEVGAPWARAAGLQSS